MRGAALEPDTVRRGRLRDGRTLLLLLALACAAGYVLTFLVALHMAEGLRLDATLHARVSGDAAGPVSNAGGRILRTIDVVTVALELVALALLGLLRGRPLRAAAAAAVVVCSAVSAELLKHGVPRIPGAVPAGRPPTFPSGHTSIAVSLGLGLVLALPPLLRPLAALAGAAYGAVIAFSVVALGWHYPSDAVGSFLLCGFWASLAGAVAGARPDRAALSQRGLAIAGVTVCATLAAAIAVADRHPAASVAVRSRPLVVAAALAFGALSVAVFGVLALLLGERPRAFADVAV